MKFITASALAFGLLASSSLAFAQLAPVEKKKTSSSQADIYTSVVRIEVVSKKADYSTPWNSGKLSRSSGTGFLIGKNRFLTNAHVVSDSERISITMHGSSMKHNAKVVHVAHDCDLAIIEVENFTPFEKLTYLKVGDIPKLESEVRVIGYPVGGDRISVTRGVVSRIDFRPYAHSRVDSHLVVQIDAAINPGNSGGPVLQGGKVIGVAFQGLTSADNTGYIIPTPVINRFLKDVKDGTYDSYVGLGTEEFPLFNEAMRKAFKLKPNDPGVLVSTVYSTASSDGILKEGDIITSIDGKTVDRSGSIKIAGERVKMAEIVERKFAGDKVKLTIIRDGKEKNVEITLKKFTPAYIYSIQYDKRPRYTIQGGLVFQPLTRNLYAANRFSSPRMRRLFSKYVSEEIFKEREDIVVLTKVLEDPINTNITGYAGNAVKSINGVEVKNFKHAHTLLHPKKLPEFFVIRLDGVSRPLILPTKNLAKANQTIHTKYAVSKSSFLGK